MEKNTVNDNILNDTIFGITFNFASIDNIFSPKKNNVSKNNAVRQKKITVSEILGMLCVQH